MNEKALLDFLSRTSAFHKQVAENIQAITPVPDARCVVSFQAAVLSVEHAMGAFLLISNALNASGYALLRPQFEAVVRGIWLLYAANDSWVDKFSQPLTLESAKPANEGLMLAEMFKQLDNSNSAPKAIVDQLKNYRDVTWKALNSYAHGGLHPLARTISGYPPQLTYDALRNGNALVAIASQLTSILSGKPENMAPVCALHRDFADCLPLI